VAGPLPESLRQRAGDQAVRDRQPQAFWVVEPGLSLVRLALGPGPVLTGVVAVMGRLAGLTVLDLAAARLRAAPFHILQGPPRPGQPPAANLRAVRGAMEAA
jgi:hypothetical protein